MADLRDESKSEEPPPRDDEAAYRSYYLVSDGRQSALIFGLFALGSVAFMKNDALLVKSASAFYGVIAARLVYIAVALASIFVFLRSKQSRAHDIATLCSVLALCVSSTVVASTRPPDYLGPALTNCIIVSIFYFALPGPLVIRIFGSVVHSIGGFWFTFKSTTPVVGENLVLTTHVLTHLLGIVIAIRTSSLRRERFMAHVEQVRARQQLHKQAAALILAKERAEQLARTKSEFLATMSHEFRTPMNAVLGLSELLSESQLAQEQRELVRTIHTSASSLLVLLNDILDVAKIEAGRMTLEKAPFDLRELIRTALDVVQYKANEKGLALESSVEDSVPAAIEGDATRLRQVLVNLLSNALKFTDKGSISVKVRSKKRSGGEHELSFEVVDTGLGISQEAQKRLFSPFEQGDASSTRRHGGTGLGLSICKNIVKLMGGELVVVSERRRGSTFSFSFCAKETTLPRQTIGQGVTRLADVLPMKILLVEDNAVNQRVAVSMLGKLGYQVDVAGNGREAVAAVKAKAYDLVLMDLRMPEMDGLEAARRIRAEIPEKKRPRIVAMTASAFEDDRLACREAGMRDFISKPVLLQDLHAALLRMQGEAPKSKPTDPVPEVATLSREALDKLRELEAIGEPGFFEDLCRQFMDDTRARLARFDGLIESGEAETLEREAHSLKSASASLGAARLGEIFAQIEAAARSAALGSIGAHLSAARAEFERVERALANEIKPA